MQELVTAALSALVPSGVRPGELSRDGRVLRWVEAGAGEPVVVLEAASGTTALTWAPIIGALAARTRVIAYDRAGLGMSDAPPRTTLESELDDLAALLSEAVGRPCVLAGSSWGGHLAGLTALGNPELVAGLVLIDPAHEDFKPVIARVVQGAVGRLLVAGALRASFAKSARRQAAASAALATSDPAQQDLLVEATLAGYARSVVFRTMLTEDALLVASRPAARALRAGTALPDIPVVVLSATTGMPAGMRARWTQLQGQIAAAASRGEHVVVPDSEHHIHASQPAAVTRAILAVVDQVRRERPGDQPGGQPGGGVPGQSDISA